MKKLLVCLWGLFLFSQAQAFENLGQLNTDARLLVLDSTTTPRQRFSDSQVTTFINQGQRLAFSNNHCLQSSLIFNLVPGTTYYALPSNYDAMLRVTIGFKWIQEMTPAALDGRSRGWEQASGYPTYYFIDFSSRSLIGFAPWPATSSDTDTVKIEFDIQPNDLVNSTDNPYNGVNELSQYNHMLAYYAAAQMSAVDGAMDKYKAYMDYFNSNLKIMEDQCTSRPNYLPSGTGSQ